VYQVYGGQLFQQVKIAQDNVVFGDDAYRVTVYFKNTSSNCRVIFKRRSIGW
jgi:hypothetical protein